MTRWYSPSFTWPPVTPHAPPFCELDDYNELLAGENYADAIDAVVEDNGKVVHSDHHCLLSN